MPEDLATLKPNELTKLIQIQRAKSAETYRPEDHKPGVRGSRIRTAILSPPTVSSINAAPFHARSRLSSPASDRLKQISEGKKPEAPKEDQEAKRSILKPSKDSSPSTPHSPLPPLGSLSLEERLQQASIYARFNSYSKDNSPTLKRAIGTRIPSRFKIKIPDPKKPNPTRKPFVPKKDHLLSAEVQRILHYQRGLHSESSRRGSNLQNPFSKKEPPYDGVPGVAQKFTDMINSKAICSLLTENMDENTSDWV